MKTENQLELSEIKRAWIDDAVDWFLNRRPRDIHQFTVEMLHGYLPPPPHPNWYGCTMAALRDSGKIREVGRVRSNRPERNGAKISLWETL